MSKREGFGLPVYIAFSALTLGIFVLCICVGSVNIPVADTFSAVWSTLRGAAVEGIARQIILTVRLPRVICVALVGSALSLCGASMQGLLRNPLADGSTLGVSTGAALGAVTAIAMGLYIPGFRGGGIMLMAILFSFLSLVLILSLAYKLDYSLSTNTIILVGVIFSMFGTSMISLITAFAGERIKTITFWTMGSLAGSTYGNVLTLIIALSLCGTILLRYSTELNAFAVGEDNARHVGIDVRRVKLIVMITVSTLIGICVSIGGTISFVGLAIPHMTRMITGPNHKKLLPASVFIGAIFLMLADLVSRVILKPLELPIGVVTSLIGSVVFIYIFYSSRRIK